MLFRLSGRLGFVDCEAKGLGRQLAIPTAAGAVRHQPKGPRAYAAQQFR